MTITFCNQKGGVGKTTMAVLTAFALAEVGRKVAIWDRDPQGSAEMSIEGSGILSHPAAADILIIDTPPNLTETLADSWRRSDRIVLVSSPYPVDLWATKRTAEEIKQLGCPAVLLFNRLRKGTLLAGQNLNEIADKIGLPSLQTTISMREAYAQAHVSGWRALSAIHRDEIFRAALEIVT